MTLADVCKEGFPSSIHGTADGVFLDLPSPWLAVPHAVNMLKKSIGGTIASFSPCMEQIYQTVHALEAAGAFEIRMWEVVLSEVNVHVKKVVVDITAGEVTVGGRARRAAGAASVKAFPGSIAKPQQDEEDVVVLGPDAGSQSLKRKADDDDDAAAARAEDEGEAKGGKPEPTLGQPYFVSKPDRSPRGHTSFLLFAKFHSKEE